MKLKRLAYLAAGGTRHYGAGHRHDVVTFLLAEASPDPLYGCKDKFVGKSTCFAARCWDDDEADIGPKNRRFVVRGCA